MHRCLLNVLLAGFLLLGRVAAQDDSVERRLEQVAGIKPALARSFLTELQRTVGIRDRLAVCALIQYPLRHADGPVRDAAACQSRYAEIFTGAVTAAIASQQFESLGVTAEGVSLGDGEVWFAAVCQDRGCPQPDLRVTAVHVVAVGPR